MKTNKTAGIFLAMGVLGITVAGSARSAVGIQQRFGCSESSRYVQAKLTFYADNVNAVDAVCEDAFTRIDALEEIVYSETGEVARINSGAGGAAVRVSDDLASLLQTAQYLSKITNGAFDATLRPYQMLWEDSRRLRRLPSEGEVRQAGGSVGWQKLRFDAGSKSLQLPSRGMVLDLKGIARGYIGDRVLEILKARGITNALYQAGSTYVASGSTPDGQGWRISRNTYAGGDPQPIRLQNDALSSFGGADGFVRIEGRYYTQMVDPRTGLPQQSGTSVMVRAGKGVMAEGLSKAFGILGSESGCGVAQAVPGTVAYFRQVKQKSGSGDREYAPEKKVAAWTTCE